MSLSMSIATEQLNANAMPVTVVVFKTFHGMDLRFSERILVGPGLLPNRHKATMRGERGGEFGMNRLAGNGYLDASCGFASFLVVQ